VTRTSSYPVEHVSGSLPIRVVAAPEAVFQLTDTEWRILFRDALPGTACGLLRSDVAVEPLDRRRCEVTLSGEGPPAFRGRLVVRAPATTVRGDLETRRAALDRAGTVTEAVERGAWWLDPARFDGYGPLGTTSVVGVRLRDVQPGPSVRPARLPLVLDFGPSGVVLRGWRNRMALRWADVTAIEVEDAASGAGGASRLARPHARGRHDTGIVVRLADGGHVRFATDQGAPPAVRAKLAALAEAVAGRSAHPGTTAQPPIDVPSLPVR